MNFDGFHVNPSGLHFGEVTKLATVLSQHVALSGAYVPEITLCVTFAAPCSGATFRVLTRCSKYITISLTSGALVSEITVCVRWACVAVRLRDASWSAFGPSWPPRPPIESGTVRPGDRLGRQPCRMKPGRLRPIAFWAANFAAPPSRFTFSTLINVRVRPPERTLQQRYVRILFCNLHSRGRRRTFSSG